MDDPPAQGDLVVIDRDECVALLEDAMFVRVAFVHDDTPHVLPVNHVIHDGALYFRTAPGSKLGTAASTGLVTVEADGGDAAARVGWSVVAHGRASIVTDEQELTALMGLRFEPWALPATRAFWVRVDVHDLQGRRIVRP